MQSIVNTLKASDDLFLSIPFHPSLHNSSFGSLYYIQVQAEISQTKPKLALLAESTISFQLYFCWQLFSQYTACLAATISVLKAMLPAFCGPRRRTQSLVAALPEVQSIPPGRRQQSGDVPSRDCS